MIVNPLIWYAERELKFVPRHFIKCPTPVSHQSKTWIQNKTIGRYAYGDDHINDEVSLLMQSSVYFENESEATMYELIWAGSN